MQQKIKWKIIVEIVAFLNNGNCFYKIALDKIARKLLVF